MRFKGPKYLFRRQCYMYDEQPCHDQHCYSKAPFGLEDDAESVRGYTKKVYQQVHVHVLLDTFIESIFVYMYFTVFMANYIVSFLS